MRTIWVLLLSCWSSCTGTISARESAPTEPPRIATWVGVRRAASDQSEVPMTLWAHDVLGGIGRIEEMEVHGAKSVYRGLFVQCYDRNAQQWIAHYVNQAQGKFTRFEGSKRDTTTTWRSVAPERTRESRLETELLDATHLRRTQSISEDSGATWNVLFTDELTLVREP